MERHARVRRSLAWSERWFHERTLVLFGIAAFGTVAVAMLALARLKDAGEPVPARLLRAAFAALVLLCALGLGTVSFLVARGRSHLRFLEEAEPLEIESVRAHEAPRAAAAALSGHALAILGFVVAAVFALDVFTSDRIATGVLYCVPVLLGFWLRRPALGFATAVAGTVLTLAGLWIRASGAMEPSGPMNCGLAILALWTTAMVGWWHLRTTLDDEDLRARLHASRSYARDADSALDAIASILIEVDERGLVRRWNGSASELLGISEAAALGRSASELPITWLGESLGDLIDGARRRSQPHEGQARFRHGGGTERTLAGTVTQVTGPDGSRTGFLLLARDITDRVAREVGLRQAQKMESIGQLAAGIAHEINTPIQYVGDNTRFLETAFQDLLRVVRVAERIAEVETPSSLDAETLAALRAEMAQADLPYLTGEVPTAIVQSLDGVQRVSHIVRAMKEFSHPGAKSMAPVDLNHALETTLTVSRNEWKYVADAETSFDPALPPVPCLAGEINQVFLNLLVNAAHAIADVVGDGSGVKGTIRVSTAVVGEHAEIRISDTGTGIPESARDRIFDPFFTTKGVGKGTGQGLTIARNVVVVGHRGTIDFETESGRGTTFIVRLPLAVEPADAEPAVA